MTEPHDRQSSGRPPELQQSQPNQRPSGTLVSARSTCYGCGIRTLAVGSDKQLRGSGPKSEISTISSKGSNKGVREDHSTARRACIVRRSGTAHSGSPCGKPRRNGDHSTPGGAVSGRSRRLTIPVDTSSSPLDTSRECPPRSSPYRACSIFTARTLDIIVRWAFREAFGSATSRSAQRAPSSRTT